MDKARKRSEAGFTLVEIVVSLVILSLGLTSLIGIQTNYIDSYLREENLSRAAMFAQYIMAMIEVEAEPPDSGRKSGNLDSYLSEIGFFDGKYSSSSSGGLEDWKFELKVERTLVPFIPDPDLLRRIDLRIYWSEFDLDSFSLVYYVKTPPKTNG